MTDRELLILAAAAEGHPYPWVLPERGGERPWNPLQDDGDALRLAMALDMRIHPMPGFGDDCVICSTDQPRIVGWAQEKFGNDKAAATRRAIVRAAAALGGATGAGGE